MSDDTDPGTSMDPDGTPPEGNTDPDDGEGTNGADGQAPDASTADLRKKNRENQALRRRLKEHEEADEARRQADLTEAERKDMRIAELEAAREKDAQRVREMGLRSDVVSEAAKLGIIHPDAAFKLLDRSELDFDDDTGRWTGVDDALRSLVAEMPYLVAVTTAATGTNASPSNPSRSRSPAKTLADLRAMTAAELREMPEAERNAILIAGK